MSEEQLNQNYIINNSIHLKAPISECFENYLLIKNDSHVNTRDHLDIRDYLVHGIA